MIIADKIWPWIGRLLCVLIVVALNGCTEVPILQPESPAFEKTFYNESDIGTNAYQLTDNPGEDSIFYQNPSFSSPDGSKFLFRQELGDGIYRLHILDLKSGENILLRNDPSFGWMPSWSGNGSEVYVGHEGKIIAIDPDTLNEREIELQTDSWITFLNVREKRILFVEEERGRGNTVHERLSIVNEDGTGYRRLYEIDKKTEFYLDHPLFIDDDKVLFLTRGVDRDFQGDFNRPYILEIGKGTLKRIPRECSHYDIHPKGDKILCTSEGYVIDLEGNILKETGIQGHGVWAPDGDAFLMTGDPIPVPEGDQYFGKIVLMSLGSDEIIPVISHENTYDSSL